MSAPIEYFTADCDVPPTVTLPARYQNVRYFAAGGMSKLFQARDSIGGSSVIVKEPRKNDDQGKLSMHNERLVLDKLQHLNIVHLRDAGIDSASIPYLVLEHVKGESLYNGLQLHDHTNLNARRKCIDYSHIVRSMLHSCMALECAHAKNILHMDIKPDNILVDKPRKRGIVIDWGLAHRNKSMHDGSLRGTLGYMAPEILRTKPLHPSLDVYGVGATMYHALTLQPPYEPSLRGVLRHTSELAAIAPIRTINPHVPKEIADVCEQAIARDSDERQSVQEFQLQLEDLLQKLEKDTCVAIAP
jgi:serine/threonine-protein kinase